MNAKSVSEISTNKGCSGCFLIPFGLIFFAAGAFFFWMIFLSPFLESISAKSWAPAKCKITKSEVETNHDSDGNSYKPIVEYTYTIDNIEHLGNRPTLQNISASHKWAKGIVKKYPVGSTTECYFAPGDHGRSVLDRDFETSFYLLAFLPLIFVAIGIGAMLAGFLGWGNTKAKKGSAISASKPQVKLDSALSNSEFSDSTNAADQLDIEWSVPKKLKPETNRWFAFLGCIAIAAFWNGIVSIFVMQLIDEPEWFLGLFLTPFILVGLLLIFGIFYTFMALFNPIVEIAMSSGAISTGGTVDLAWEVVGKARSFNNFKIQILGEQAATYRQGTSTLRANEVFEIVEVIETSSCDEMEFGSTTIIIPADTMHTFESEHNSINWKIVVHGSIPWWPDVRQAHSFRVKPG